MSVMGRTNALASPHKLRPLLPPEARALFKQRPAHTLQRRFITDRLFPKRKLRRLEEEANQESGDVRKQLAFMKELNKHYPEFVVKRYDRGGFATDEAVLKEYIKALVACKQIDRTALRDLSAKAEAAASGFIPQQQASMMNAQPGMAGMASSGSMNAYASGNNANEPMFVTMVEGGWRSQLWKTVRMVAVTFLLISAVGVLMDERGVGGKMGQSTVNEAVSSDKCFDDVKGCKEAKAELEEIVLYLKDPKRFTRLGGKLPKGMLLMGPPGTGKTLLARAIAGEAGVPFFYASGSEFEEMYVGVGARRVRDLFEAAGAKSPCIIFIDEIDAIGGTRQMKEQQAMKMTLNQLLVEMDGFEQNNGVIVIGATNFPEVLDDALMRPGRFDKHVTVPLPDVAGRREILDHYLGAIPCDEDVSVDVLARGTPGMSGAELSNLVNQAALKASLEGDEAVSHATLEYAKDKILMGAERKSAVISPESARLTAYHEGGHALVAIKTRGAHPIHKATIMPRGQALGMVSQLPEGDQTSMSRREMMARLDVCMGGRVAEEIVFGVDEVTSGASSDLMQATRLATQMVTQWGFSDEIGPVFHNSNGQFGPQTRDVIDKEVKTILASSYERAKNILQVNRRDLDRLAKALIEFETLTGEEVQKVLNGKRIRVDVKKPTPKSGGSNSSSPSSASAASSGDSKQPLTSSQVASNQE
jgi:ATP-dependent metalloprotease